MDVSLFFPLLFRPVLPILHDATVRHMRTDIYLKTYTQVCETPPLSYLPHPPDLRIRIPLIDLLVEPAQHERRDRRDQVCEIKESVEGREGREGRGEEPVRVRGLLGWKGGPELDQEGQEIDGLCSGSSASQRTLK
jgi:hypothetical protein